MKKYFLILLLSLSSLAQTNLPPMPGAIAGKEKLYWVTCSKCYTKQHIVAKSFKLKKVKRGLGGEEHILELTFLCSKCGKTFMSLHSKWLPNASDQPQVSLGTKAFSIPSKPKEGYIYWDFPCTNGPVEFTVEHSIKLPPVWAILASNVQASPYKFGSLKEQEYFRVMTHRPN